MRNWIMAVLCISLISATSTQSWAEDNGATPSIEAIDDPLLSPEILQRKKELKATKTDYLGDSTEPVCKTQNGVNCRQNAACCTGGTLCRILLSKIRKLVDKIPGETYAPEDFCS